jgi:amino-acid N-acetyltransferase
VVYVTESGTPDGHRPARAVMGFWRDVLEAEPILIGAEAHDRQLAWTSHLPQAAAEALAKALADQHLGGVSFGSGARDTTRLAGSSPEMWSDILLYNQPALDQALEQAGAALAQLRELLAACDLGSEGLEYAFPGGYVVVESAGELLGAAGVEVRGQDGLLRSVAVAPGQRGSGLGALLVRNRLEWAAKNGLRAVYLLTTSAADFFGWMGFWRIDRDEAPEDIRKSEQFSGACPASAVVMLLQLS